MFLFFMYAVCAALLTVFARGNTGLFFKNAGEVALVVKSDRTGDLRDRMPVERSRVLLRSIRRRLTYSVNVQPAHP